MMMRADLVNTTHTLIEVTIAQPIAISTNPCAIEAHLRKNTAKRSLKTFDRVFVRT